MTAFADCIFHNGHIYTADNHNSICNAVAIKEGRIIAVGRNESIMKYASETTKLIDLEGKMLMPGIIDAHLHPFWGGHQLVSCRLNYEALTVEEILNRIQKSLDSTPLNSPNDWFQVRAWLRSAMIPSGTDITCHDLNKLNTQRPVILFSNDCHTLVANSRALTLFGINKETPDADDGKIGRFSDGRPNGILEDAPAMRAYDSIPQSSFEQNLHVAELVQHVLNKEGITTVLDARIQDASIALIEALKNKGELTLRYCCAKEIMPSDAPTLSAIPTTVKKITEFCHTYRGNPITPDPDLSILSVKFFVDGVLHPMKTAFLLEPYLENKGSETEPNIQTSKHYGDLYFPAETLETLVVECAKANFDLHFHTVGDGAIETTLNAIEKMRVKYPQKDIRPTLAHNELVSPHQYKRFTDLNVTAVLSFQWAGLLESIVDEEKTLLGDARFCDLEPAAKFIDAGARVAYGSDWPIDTLDTWFNLQVAVTRIGHTAENELPFRLDNDRDLTIIEALRSATIDAAYLIHMDKYVGSLEVGKFADLIVLDKNLFTSNKYHLEDTQVVLTMVGGKVVYEQDIKS